MGRLLFIIGLLVFIIVAAFGTALVIRLVSPVVDAASPMSWLNGEGAREAVEAYFRTSLPPTPLIDQFFIGRRNNDYWIRFNVDKDELHGLLSTSPVLVCNDLALLEGLRPEFAFHDLSLAEQSVLSWWTPDDVVQYVGSDCVGEDLTSYKILVDNGNPEIWTIYLEITSPQA